MSQMNRATEQQSLCQINIIITPAEQCAGRAGAASRGSNAAPDVDVHLRVREGDGGGRETSRRRTRTHEQMDEQRDDPLIPA